MPVVTTLHTVQKNMSPPQAKVLRELLELSVIFTFGILSPNKGIEYMSQALPAIVEKHPDVAYIILGAT